jgi:predicted acylesterase/phospholipase RssA
MSALVGGMCGRRDHLVSDRELRQLIRGYIEFEDLADAAVPLHLVAFDLIEGREMLLSEGPAVEAIAASASIPGIFPPVAIGDRRLIDGGVVNNTPISHAVELGAERIYILPTQAPARPTRAHPDGRARRGHSGSPSARGLSGCGRRRQVLGRGRADHAPRAERRLRAAHELRVLPPPDRRRARPPGRRSSDQPAAHTSGW